ncbi:MAG: rod shape-determining protein RodA [Gemmatimonadaceae bacterium]
MRRTIADAPLVALALLLSAFGIAMVYSAGITDMPTVARGAWERQLFWLALGLGGAYVASRMSVRIYEWLTTPAYLATLGLLAVTLVLGRGAGTAASQKGWIGFGSLRIQPAEFAKITVVLMLAQVLAARKDAPKTLLDLWKPALVVGIPWLLIMLQPDLGTGIVFIGIFFLMLYWSGVPWPLLLLVASPVVSLVLAGFGSRAWGAWFILLMALILWYKPFLSESVVLGVVNVVMGVLAPILWNRLQPYQQRRLLVFLDPNLDPRASGYHVIQSTVAIGSGGWFGKGFTMGTQKRLAFLPAQHTDFIFAVVGEELGFIGVTLALTLFVALFLRIVRVAERANDSFSSLVAFGLLSSWFVHVAENVGMTLNLAPITGIPLPFFSYGGSFMLASWLAIGMLVRISSEGRGRADSLAV